MAECFSGGMSSVGDVSTHYCRSYGQPDWIQRGHRAVDGWNDEQRDDCVVAGNTSFIAFRREPAVGVAILSNRGLHQAIQSLTRQLVALLPLQ